jgi:hypothetical protein
MQLQRSAAFEPKEIPPGEQSRRHRSKDASSPALPALMVRPLRMASGAMSVSMQPERRPVIERGLRDPREQRRQVAESEGCERQLAEEWTHHQRRRRASRDAESSNTRSRCGPRACPERGDADAWPSRRGLRRERRSVAERERRHEQSRRASVRDLPSNGRRCRNGRPEQR